MSSPVDSVARRDRAMNGALGRWIATLKPTVEVLRSFHPEAWPVFVILATCLIMAGLYPFFAASNAVLVFTVASLGCLVGSRIGQLAVWSGSILVPRHTRSLFALCVSSVVLAAILTGLACWSLGNPAPAVAPALLVGAAMMRYAIRRPVVPRVVAVWWVILAFVTLCGVAFDGARQPLVQLAQFSSVLSHVWIQLAVLVGVGLILPGTQRALVPPTTGIDRTVQSLIGFGNLAREDGSPEGSVGRCSSARHAHLDVVLLSQVYRNDLPVRLARFIRLRSPQLVGMHGPRPTVTRLDLRYRAGSRATGATGSGSRRLDVTSMACTRNWLVGHSCLCNGPGGRFLSQGSPSRPHCRAPGRHGVMPFDPPLATVLSFSARRLSFGACVSRECMRVLCVLRLPCGGLRVAYLRADRRHSIDRVPRRSRPGASGGPDGDSRSSSR